MEYFGVFQDTAHIVARQIDPGDFVVGNRASLNGVPIRQWLSQPRKLKTDGSLDEEVFTFALVAAADVASFAIDQVVELANEGS